MSNLQAYQEGPLSMLKECVENRHKVIIDIGGRSNKKLIAQIVDFDYRFNMVLRDIIETWSERRGRVTIQRQRYIAQMYLPGHSVRIVVKITE